MSFSVVLLPSVFAVLKNAPPIQPTHTARTGTSALLAATSPIQPPQRRGNLAFDDG